MNVPADVLCRIVWRRQKRLEEAINQLAKGIAALTTDQAGLDADIQALGSAVGDLLSAYQSASAKATAAGVGTGRDSPGRPGELTPMMEAGVIVMPEAQPVDECVENPGRELRAYRPVSNSPADITDPVLAAMIRDATCRVSDPNDWTEEEVERAINEGWLTGFRSAARSRPEQERTTRIGRSGGRTKMTRANSPSGRGVTVAFSPCVDAVACPDCGGVGRDANANFWCCVCEGVGSVPARLRHYEVVSPEMVSGGSWEPPDPFRCWGVYLAPNAKAAKVMAIKDPEFKEWVRETRGFEPPFKGLTVRLFRCEHGRCWSCDTDEDGIACDACVTDEGGIRP